MSDCWALQLKIENWKLKITLTQNIKRSSRLWRLPFNFQLSIFNYLQNALEIAVGVEVDSERAFAALRAFDFDGGLQTVFQALLSLAVASRQVATTFDLGGGLCFGGFYKLLGLVDGKLTGNHLVQ